MGCNSKLKLWQKLSKSLTITFFCTSLVPQPSHLNSPTVWDYAKVRPVHSLTVPSFFLLPVHVSLFKVPAVAGEYRNTDMSIPLQLPLNGPLMHEPGEEPPLYKMWSLQEMIRTLRYHLISRDWILFLGSVGWVQASHATRALRWWRRRKSQLGGG